VKGRAVLVTAASEASGAKAVAAALVCAGSEPDRAGLLIDVGGRPPRPTLIASSGARQLEERLVVHLPNLRAASRGGTCHLAVPADETWVELIPAALPLVRDSIAAIHLPAHLLRTSLDAPGISPSGVLLRADLGVDRALIALAVGEFAARGLKVAVLKQPLAWIQARRALFGVLPAGATGGLPPRLIQRLLSPMRHECYSDADDAEADPAGTSEQERRDHASAR
jgi:hypothetical protein